MNHKAIDAGATAFTKIEIPADWATAEDAPSTITLEGREALLKQVRDIMTPVSRMEGDALPVSAFKNHVDGQFELGAAAYEKRGIAVVVPEWNVEKCIQCNQCAYVCPHAVIRPFVLTDEEVAAAPAQSQFKDAVGPKAKGYKFEIAISQLDCTGCSNCVYICPADALTMKPIEEQESKQEILTTQLTTSPRRPSLLLTTSRHPSSRSLFLSSPVPAQAALRPATAVWSLSSSAIVCLSPTQLAAPPFGVTQLLAHHLLPMQTATAQHGTTPSLRTMQSTVWV